MLLFIGLLLLLLGLSVITISENLYVRILALIAVIIGLGFIGFDQKIGSPTALDVYRGKTTLKITVIQQDSIIVYKDSTVVFKN